MALGLLPGFQYETHIDGCQISIEHSNDRSRDDNVTTTPGQCTRGMISLGNMCPGSDHNRSMLTNTEIE